MISTEVNFGFLAIISVRLERNKLEKKLYELIRPNTVPALSDS